MALFQIPLTNEPQTFQISIAGKEYSLTCKYNEAEEAGWVLDFFDAETEEPIVYNVPLICGADCLAGLDYLGFNGKIYVYTDGAGLVPPTLENLGVESFVYFETEITDE